VTTAERYNRSEKGRARHRRYNVSEKGRARARRYHETHPQVSMFGQRFRMPSPEFAEFARRLRDERKAEVKRNDAHWRATTFARAVRQETTGNQWDENGAK
jgi:hypothetical protein